MNEGMRRSLTKSLGFFGGTHKKRPPLFRGCWGAKVFFREIHWRRENRPLKQVEHGKSIGDDRVPGGV